MLYVAHAVSGGGFQISFLLKLHYVKNFFWIVRVTLGVTVVLFILIMSLLTLERFFEVYLNIKNELFWSPEKAKVVLGVVFISSFFSSIPVYIVSLSNSSDVGKHWYVTFTQPFNIFYYCSYLQLFLHYKTNL